MKLTPEENGLFKDIISACLTSVPGAVGRLVYVQNVVLFAIGALVGQVVELLAGSDGQMRSQLALVVGEEVVVVAFFAGV